MPSSIEWTDESWNPVTGCTRVSPGCDHCYMFALYPRLRGMGVPGYETSPDDVRLLPERLQTPLSWKKPRLVFVNSIVRRVPSQGTLRFHPSNVLSNGRGRIAAWACVSGSDQAARKSGRMVGAEPTTLPQRDGHRWYGLAHRWRAKNTLRGSRCWSAFRRLSVSYLQSRCCPVPRGHRPKDGETCAGPPEE